MKLSSSLRLILIGAILIALPIVASAHAGSNRPWNDCHTEPQGCLHKMLAQIKQIRVYLVAHVKPGDPVEFNPQPDPPGDPDPWYRKANEAYFGLTQEFADFTSHQAEIPLLKPTSQRRAAFESAVGDAQTQLTRLGQRSDRQGATSSVTALTASINRISQLVARK
jgi:hypothetical protein